MEEGGNLGVDERVRGEGGFEAGFGGTEGYCGALGWGTGRQRRVVNSGSGGEERGEE